MKLLSTKAEFINAKASHKLSIQCPICNLPFLRTKRDIEIGIVENRDFYCSTECKNKGIIIHCECDECHKAITQLPSVYKLYKNHFCSSSCGAKYRNRMGTLGAKTFKLDVPGKNRSKAEIWLEEKILLLYPNLEIHFNRRDTINSELDIYIPSLKLAFELNGTFHYEPIWGTDKLSSIQNNDKRKYQACLERGIELCIIDASDQHTKYFKEAKSQKYLDIIKGIIDLKYSVVHGNYVAENI